MSKERKRTKEQVLSSLSCTQKEAAMVLGVGARTVSELIRTKRLVSFPSGAYVRVSVPAMLRWLNGEGGEETQAA